VTVQAAHWIGRRLSEPGEYYSGRDRALLPESRWPLAARFDGQNRWRVEISSFPVWLKREPLASFLQHAGNPLSVRATRGFLARADSSSLRFEKASRIEFAHIWGAWTGLRPAQSLTRFRRRHWDHATWHEASQAGRPET
jgi:hypothetical protein